MAANWGCVPGRTKGRVHDPNVLARLALDDGYAIVALMERGEVPGHNVEHSAVSAGLLA